MKEILYKICDEALKKFPEFTDLYSSKKRFEMEFQNLTQEDITKYNFMKLYYETWNSDVLDKFLNVTQFVNCEIYKRNYNWFLVIHHCLRTLKEQADLWLKGRYEKGDVVTWVIPGESLHNYGCAIDLVFWKNGFSWDEKHPWEVIPKIAIKYNCNTIPGDKPHVEYRLKEVLDLRKEVAIFIAKRMKEAGFDPFLKRKTIPNYLKNI